MMNLGNKYRFYIKNPEAARAEFRTWQGRANICVADVIATGFIDIYTTDPQRFADKIGGASWELIK